LVGETTAVGLIVEFFIQWFTRLVNGNFPVLRFMMLSSPYVPRPPDLMVPDKLQLRLDPHHCACCPFPGLCGLARRWGVINRWGFRQFRLSRRVLLPSTTKAGYSMKLHISRR
jgi:hypothetical protein